MNLHFTFNALNSIQALVSINDSKTARLYLAKFSKLMRQILDNSRKATIPLENEIAALENYLAIEQFCHNHRFEYEINIDDNVDSEKIELSPILIQPFVRMPSFMAFLSMSVWAKFWYDLALKASS